MTRYFKEELVLKMRPQPSGFVVGIGKWLEAIEEITEVVDVNISASIEYLDSEDNGDKEAANLALESLERIKNRISVLNETITAETSNLEKSVDSIASVANSYLYERLIQGEILKIKTKRTGIADAIGGPEVAITFFE